MEKTYRVTAEDSLLIANAMMTQYSAASQNPPFPEDYLRIAREHLTIAEENGLDVTIQRSRLTQLRSRKVQY